MRPQCRSCRLRKSKCVYTVAAPTQTQEPTPEPPTYDVSHWSSFGGSSHSPSSSSYNDGLSDHETVPFDALPIVVSEPQFRPAGVDGSEMRLLWFYANKTCRTFSANNAIGEVSEGIMRGLLVQYAFQTPFLMDTIFALSCLHLEALSDNADKSRTIAYRARSYEGYRTAIAEADPVNFPALIANSLLVTALSSQVFRDPYGQDLYILDWMVVWRGIRLIRSMVSAPSYSDSGLDGLFCRPTINLDDAAHEIPNHLLFMVTAIKPDDDDHLHIQIYHEALKYLATLYYHLRKGMDTLVVLRIITWLTYMPDGYVELARLKRPRALIIMAHYALFLKLTVETWWFRGIGDRSLRDLCKAIGPEWDHFMIVPHEALEEDDLLKLCKLILQDESYTFPPPGHAQKTVETGEVGGKYISYVSTPTGIVLRDADITISPDSLMTQ